MILTVLMCQIGFVGDFDINKSECKIVQEHIMADVTERQCMSQIMPMLPNIVNNHPKYEIKKFFCTDNSGSKHNKT